MELGGEDAEELRDLEWESFQSKKDPGKSDKCMARQLADIEKFNVHTIGLRDTQVEFEGPPMNTKS